MKFSILLEMQISDPTRASEAQLFHDCVEQAVLADQLGYETVWVVEHHGLREYSHSSAPETFLAFVAARTRRIRLGHGVTLLPHRYNHPIRVAERIATPDILSGGRVNWGTGKSSSLVEQAAFENELPQLHDQWREAMEIIPRMWADDVFQHRGRFFDIPPTQVVPKPVQNPHPPAFMACSRPESAALAGTLGLGALNFSFGRDSELKVHLARYREGIAKCVPVTKHITNHFACTASCIVLEDNFEACRYGLTGGLFFTQSMSKYYQSKDRPVGRLQGIQREPVSLEMTNMFMKSRHAQSHSWDIVCGDPANARGRVQRWADLGVDELILCMQLGTVPHAITMHSLRNFAEGVMPHFAS